MSDSPALSTLRNLAENKTEGITKSTTFRVDPSLIQFEEGFNLRTENDELLLHIDRLAAAMEAGAFIPPVDVSVVNGTIVARDGHCRTRAAMKVREKMPEYTLECRQLRGNETDAVLHMLGTGSGSKPLTPLEQGRGYLRLVKMGLTSPQIATKLGISRVTVDNGLTLAEAPVEVQQMVEAGEVSSTTAREAIKQGADGVEALKQAVQEERTNPTPAKNKNGKKSTKKKVTAKKLRGTAADKKAKPAKKKAGKASAPATAPAETAPAEIAPAAPVSPDEVSVTVNREQAKAAVEFLRAFAKEDEALQHFASQLETVLL